jgi:hypothetical protein
MVQWHRWTFKGSAEVGRVRVKWVLRQWQRAVKVLVSYISMMSFDKYGQMMRSFVEESRI